MEPQEPATKTNRLGRKRILIIDLEEAQGKIRMNMLWDGPFGQYMLIQSI